MTQSDQSNEISEKSLTTASLLSLMSLQTAVLVLLGAGLWWASGRPMSALISIDAQQIGLGVAIGIGLAVVVGTFFYLFPKASEALVRAQGHNLKFLEKKLSFGAIVVISIGAGIGEEVLFRAGILSLASDYMTMSLAVLLSSLLFALMHLAKPIISAIIFVIGCFFAVIYVQTGSLLTVIIGHAVYDVYALWYVQKELHRIGYFEEPTQEAVEPQPS